MSAIFCGIGVCQACAAPGGERTCLRAGEPVPVPGADLVVLGAGPAGLAAALAAADAGVSVLVVDRGERPGGQFLRGSTRSPLVRRALAHGRIAFLLGHEVWQAGPDRSLSVAPVGSAAGTTLRPAAIVVATGAYDRVVPFPGWELPGVITVGGAQARYKSFGELPGRRVLVAGSGPLLLSLGVLLGDAVVAVADEVGLLPWLRHLPAVLGAPAKIAQAAGYRSRLLRSRVPVWSGWRLVSVSAVDGGLKALLRKGSRERSVEVDAVAVGWGFTPQTEIAAALGCTLGVDERDGSVIVTDRPAGVHVAGEITGVGGATAAVATGTLAGLAAAAHLGRLDSPTHRRLARPWLRRAAAARRFAGALHDVHRVRPVEQADETVLCRCENVTYGVARAAMALGADDPRALKLLTRVGMGRCQGRLCGSAAAGLLGCDPTPYAYRPVAVPVPLRLLLAAGRPEEDS
ncbi:FAD/NAD(P)-dependent oxidoreductase [Hamadaea tsunoensis]|uniref:FAD/NAD(P)-dependent oxidoreductase n=1 Tax=Hamadaea tsunoensis TaxID=53368 RepID=UPI0003FA276B|nr:NAD(P)/FAD-dependent oxidoreductase [Hamadaea tsunoensis]